MEIIINHGAQCRDCYKCVRSCPLKAIRVSKGQAHVLSPECIGDGLCTQVCPQGAKELVHEWNVLKNWLHQGERVVVSLAPSYLGLQMDPYHFNAALYLLGVERIEETAWAVPAISAKYWTEEHLLPAITSACPSLVYLVEKHFPRLVNHLVPVMSPMVLHGRSLKKRYPGAKVVFIGPCPAKKLEQSTYSDDVDLALTFAEVSCAIKSGMMQVQELPPRKPDISGSSTARQFSMQRGWQKSWSGGEISGKVWAISGFAECIDFLSALQQGSLDGQWAELMICKGGCLGGAGWNDNDGPFVRQSRLMDRIQSHHETTRPSWEELDSTRRFHAHPVKSPSVEEGQIAEVLRASGKHLPQDLLDCGACGYNTCRAKAIAVLQGKAELEMCIPYMRSKAESMSNVIIETTPNGIVVVDSSLRILATNPALEHMFKCKSSEVQGKSLAALFDPQHFNHVRINQELISVNVSYPDYALVTRQLIFPVRKQNVVIGIFLDITNEQNQHQELSKLKQETLHRAQEVIEKQMRVAQEIAGLLGETTAETKILLSRLIKVIEQDDDPSLVERGGGFVSGEGLREP